ncbi:MAG: hypothetical protein J2P19_19065 [Pseudonocardia sp.]|nr:hypothetical protein [Pseudonocardia sp.]
MRRPRLGGTPATTIATGGVQAEEFFAVDGCREARAPGVAVVGADVDAAHPLTGTWSGTGKAVLAGLRLS